MPLKIVRERSLRNFMLELTMSTGLFINVVRPSKISGNAPLPVIFVSERAKVLAQLSETFF